MVNTVQCGSCRATAEVPDCEACPADVRAIPVGWSWLIAVAHAHPGRREWRLLVCGACVGPTDQPKFFTCTCGAWQAYHERGEVGGVCSCDRGVPLSPVEVALTVRREGSRSANGQTGASVGELPGGDEPSRDGVR